MRGQLDYRAIIGRCNIVRRTKRTIDVELRTVLTIFDFVSVFFTTTTRFELSAYN